MISCMCDCSDDQVSNGAVNKIIRAKNVTRAVQVCAVAWQP